MQLHQQFHDQGLEIVTLNIDGESGFSDAETLLRSQKVTLTNWALTESSSTEVLAALQCEELLAGLYLYDRQGKLRHEFTGIDDEEEMHAALTALLATAP